MTLMDEIVQNLETKTKSINQWTIAELKEEMFRLANEDHNVLKQFREIPQSSYENYSKYQTILEEGKKRAINFEIAHDYLQSTFLKK